MVTVMSEIKTDCPRCGGYLATQLLRDYEFDGVWHKAKRCVNCGCILDAVIDRHRQSTHSWQPKRFRLRYQAPRAIKRTGRS